MAEPVKVQRLERRPAPERDILTARERLDRDRGTRRPLKGVVTGVTILLVFLLCLAGLFLGLSALESDRVERAPWASPTAPDVRPQGLDEQ